MLKKLYLKNFMVFDDLEMEFSPKVNVIIGENGTGKTQLMKVAYAILKSTDNVAKENSRNAQSFGDNLLKLFKPLKNSVAELRKRNSELPASIYAIFDTDDIMNFEQPLEGRGRLTFTSPPIHSPVFVPTKEVFTLFENLKLKDVPESIIEDLFDLTYVDIITYLEDDSLGGQKMPERNPILEKAYMSIAEKINGVYKFDEGRISFTYGKYHVDGNAFDSKDGSFYADAGFPEFYRDGKDDVSSVTMTAEGYRKLGILQRLLANGSFYSSDGKSPVLFWDEPEANLNPKLMRLAVETLLELSRSGIQVVVATHNYVLLRWFDLLAKEKDDHVKFHSLYFENDVGQIAINSVDSYLEIQPNIIDDIFEQIVEAEIDKEMPGIKKLLEEEDDA